MALVFTVSPLRVSRAGGDKITLTGTFPRDHTYAVTVGGVAAYSGVSGQGNVLLTPNETTLTFAMPPQPTAGAKTVALSKIGSTPDSGTSSITALERVFRSAVFSLRRMFPPWYATGPRRLELEPPA
jgi:hypothetical protein